MSLVLTGYRGALWEMATEPSQLILRYLTVTFQLSLDRLPPREHTPVPGNAGPRPVGDSTDGSRYLRSLGGPALPGGELPQARVADSWLHRQQGRLPRDPGAARVGGSPRLCDRSARPVPEPRCGRPCRLRCA